MIFPQLRARFGNRLDVFVVAALFVTLFSSTAFSRTPECRLDNRLAHVVKQAIHHSIDAYKIEGLNIPFALLPINPRSEYDGYRVELVLDARNEEVDAFGCIEESIGSTTIADKDRISVDGVCKIPFGKQTLLRCSVEALTIVQGQSDSDPSPALLYVMAHEIAHFLEQDFGAFTSQNNVINLSQPNVDKFRAVEKGCVHKNEVSREREADRKAINVLSHWLSQSPYRNSILSERAAILQNLNILRLGADQIAKWAQENNPLDAKPTPFIFDANAEITLPANQQRIIWARNRFVCDLRTATKGTYAYPLLRRSHPSAEVRMQRVAERMTIAAKEASDIEKSQLFDLIPPLDDLIEDTGSVYAFIDAEFGIYFQKLHGEICKVSRTGNWNTVPNDCSQILSWPPGTTPPRKPIVASLQPSGAHLESTFNLSSIKMEGSSSITVAIQEDKLVIHLTNFDRYVAFFPEDDPKTVEISEVVFPPKLAWERNNGVYELSESDSELRLRGPGNPTRVLREEIYANLVGISANRSSILVVEDDSEQGTLDLITRWSKGKQIEVIAQRDAGDMIQVVERSNGELFFFQNIDHHLYRYHKGRTERFARTFDNISAITIDAEHLYALSENAGFLYRWSYDGDSDFIDIRDVGISGNPITGGLDIGPNRNLFLLTEKNVHILDVSAARWQALGD